MTKELCRFLTENGACCAYRENRPRERERLDPCRVPDGTECVLVVGGDGTLLETARNMAGRDIPLIGVNTGHVGYLCELEADTAMEGMRQLLASDGRDAENRMLLAGSFPGEDGRKEERTALNDIVIHRFGSLRVIDLVISVNGKYLNTYSADGVILATPTGSTGYSMSAGGPIVDPGAELILVTPICSHALNAKSIVLGAGDEVTVEVGRRDGGESVEVSFDGGQVGTLRAGEKIVVRKAGTHAKILNLSRLSFLERLRKKLQAYS